MTSYSDDVKTPLARLAFANNLFRPGRSGGDDTGKEKFQATLLFSKSTDITALKKAASDAAMAEWGDKAADMMKNGLIRSPFLDGDGPQGCNKKSGDRNPGFAGHVFVRLSATKERPPKLFGKTYPLVPAVENEELFSGCYVEAVVGAYTWEHPQNGKGVSFGFSMMRHAKDGERLGRPEADPNNYFGKIEGSEPIGDKAAGGAAGLFA